MRVSPSETNLAAGFEQSALAADQPNGGDEQLAGLKRFQSEHPIWSCRMIRACRAGQLTKDDFKYIFSQYYKYSKNFTRYLTALMTNCDSDYYRSVLSENLYEEGGGAEPQKRHAELFRRFLQRGLGVDIESVRFQSFADEFFRQYLDFCRNSTPLATAAFLSLGTEGVVSRLYGYFHDGLLKAGVDEEHLTFFALHMECDDLHALTLTEMMRFYSTEPCWFEHCRAAIDKALNIRMQFLEDALDFALNVRIKGLLDSIREGHQLLPRRIRPENLLLSREQPATEVSSLYSNSVGHLNIDFSVRRVQFGADVFDVRLVTIPPHRNNEYHRHSHESLLTVMKGKGRVRVGDSVLNVSAGDTVFVPRWEMHQTQNTGDEVMELLAVTDYGLTQQAFLGDSLRTTRMSPEADVDAKSLSQETVPQ
jgi:quercetin dioxygenase-like cupin family protein/pyrroloquinoline quinone (PQQ) biosynthesis protein C